MKEVYKKLVNKLRTAEPQPTKYKDSYGGNKDKKLNLRIRTIRRIAKDFVMDHKKLAAEEWVEVFHLLSRGEFDEEKQVIGKILESNKKLRRSIDPQEIDKILSEMKGWSQVDSLCQSVFSAEDLLSNWKSWKGTIMKLSESSNPNKKRASLVLLTAPVRQSDEKIFSELAFCLIDRLKAENNKLVTKAVSWILREMTKNHREEVENYVNQNRKSLPAVAVRETENKLRTGKK